MPIHPDNQDIIDRRGWQDHRWLSDCNHGLTGDFSEFQNQQQKASHMTKEEAYDDKIAPLMAQIIEICKEHKIANVCSFALGEDDNGDELMCTTAFTANEFDPPDELKRCVSILCRQEPQVSMMTVRDADGNILSSTAFLGQTHQ